MNKQKYSKTFILFILVWAQFILFNFVDAQEDTSAINTEQVANRAFVFPHETGRIFATPTAEVLKSLDLNFILGGSFGFEENTSFLGNVAFGLGNFADIEINTSSLLGTLALSSSNISTIALKGRIINGNAKLPSVAIGLRASNDWDKNKLNESGVRTASPDLFREGLRGLDYEARMTTAFTVASKEVNDNLCLHGGLGITDLRYRNAQTVIWIEPGYRTYQQVGVKRKNLVSVFGGIVYTINDRTQFMIEVQNMPYFDVNLKDGSLVPRQRGLAVGEVRFAISKTLLLDTGIRYQSNFKGLADAQIRLSLSFFFPIKT